MTKSKHSFVCSNKCYSSQLPFFDSDDIDFFSAIFSEGLYPCIRCKRDCLENMACIRCSVCNVWCHHICSDLTDKQFVSNNYFYCGSKCENFNITFLPFNGFSHSVLMDSDILIRPKLMISASNKNKAKGPEIQLKKSADNFIKPDQFLDIKCSYLCPNEIKEEHMSHDSSELSIFHNNIRSINKNLDSAEEIFINSKKLPDIIC